MTKHIINVITRIVLLIPNIKLRNSIRSLLIGLYVWQKKSKAAIDTENRYYFYTRFSLINKYSSGHWRVGRSKKKEDYIKSILDENRLKLRSKIFFEYALPTIKFLTNYYNIYYQVTASSMLPDWLKNDLGEWEKLDWFSVQYVDYDEEFTLIPDASVSNFMKSKPSTCDEALLAVVRIDDDDLLSPMYFKIMEQFFKPKFVGMCVSLISGYRGLFQGGKFVKFSKRCWINASVGLAYMAKYSYSEDKIITKYNCPPGAHHTVNQRVGTILEEGFPVYIYSITGDNDSGSIESELKKYFDKIVDFDIVKENFPIFCEKDEFEEKMNDMMKKIGKL